jgi:endonuclease/exonuclease/phosphatase (EEP) superfamily protein YafD
LELKTDFLKELMEEILFQQNPVIVGGDFNLVRDMTEKSNGVINEIWFRFLINL